MPSLDVGRDSTHAEAVARGIVAVLDAPPALFGTYNISNGVRYTVAETLTGCAIILEGWGTAWRRMRRACGERWGRARSGGL